MEKGVQSSSSAQFSGISTASTGGNRAASNGSSGLTLRVVQILGAGQFSPPPGSGSSPSDPFSPRSPHHRGWSRGYARGRTAFSPFRSVLQCNFASSAVASSRLSLSYQVVLSASPAVHFNVSPGFEKGFSEEDFSLAFGELRGTDGLIRNIGKVEVQHESDKPRYTNFLASNYPNPFNPVTVIEYSIAGESHVNLSIYNVAGQLVRTLVDEKQKANEYRIKWDGRDNEGRRVSSGVYFYRIKTKNFSKTKKLVILR